MSLGAERATLILAETLEAAIRGDVDAVAEATRPLFIDGDDADLYGTLVGLLHVVETCSPLSDRPAGPLGLTLLNLDTGIVTEPEDAPADVVAYSRLLVAHLNRDHDTSIALWRAVLVGDDGDTAGQVIALAIKQAADALRSKWGERS